MSSNLFFHLKIVQNGCQDRKELSFRDEQENEWESINGEDIGRLRYSYNVVYRLRYMKFMSNKRTSIFSSNNQVLSFLGFQ